MAEIERPAALGALADRIDGTQNSVDSIQKTERSRSACGPITVSKNSRDALRFAIDEYHERLLLSARVWFKPGDGGDLRPGREGWAVSIERLPDVIAALQQLEAEARAGGLL